MPKIVVIEKAGTLKTISVKDFTEESLYKKVGLKSGEGFLLQHTWGAEDGVDQSIRLYGKKSGRAGQENKYDFPPPVDNVLFFGPCVLVGTDPKTGDLVDLEEDDWEEIYEYLFGGFEDVGSEDESDEDDVDTDDELVAMQQNGVIVKQTKEGYAKDGFIVDESDEDETKEKEEDEESEDDESEVKPPPKKPATKGRKPAVNKPTIEVPVHVQNNDLNVEDCESELSEESYD